jgi:ferrous iron transport protein B
MNSATLKKVMIVGLPNTGKSQVFNNLTGEYSVVANSPLTTIHLRKTECRIGDQTYEIIDTPGLHCLYIHSEEELVVREAIFSEKPDVIIQCIDANRLKQSLALTVDLLTLGIPMLISLNAIDETARKGMWIDSDGLSRILGVPVIESMAVHGQGTRELKEALGRAPRGSSKVQYGDVIENGLLSIEARLRADFPYKRTASILLLMNDPFTVGHLGKKPSQIELAGLMKEVEEVRGRFRGNINHFISNRRNRWIDDVTEKVVKRQKIAPKELSQGIARLSRHPLFGIPVLLMVVYTMFFLVVNVANKLSEWMNDILWMPVEKVINGIFPAGFLHDLLIGDYGVLSLGLANALLTVLPILSVFFIMFNTLEDIGYIANLAVLTKRILGKLGLSGGAIMPLVLGFGCKTMATLTTRTLRSRRERYIAVYLIAFAIPCAAQMGLHCPEQNFERRCRQNSLYTGASGNTIAQS